MSHMAHDFGTVANRGAGPLDARRAADLLLQLKEVHAEIEEAVQVLNEIAIPGRPDLVRYPHARWQLSTLRRKRRIVASEIHAALLAALPKEDGTVIEELRTDDVRRLQSSALHVQEWTSHRIAGDWDGYCAASRPMRDSLRAWVARERKTLYPLLEHFARVA